MQLDDGIGAANLPRPRRTCQVKRRRTHRTDDDGPRTLYGHFTPFDQWSEINSMWEGNFLERTEKGAFSKTIKESRQSIRVLYDHGHDPQIGNKPLGPIKELREEEFGPFYEVPLIDTDYNRNFIIPPLPP